MSEEEGDWKIYDMDSKIMPSNLKYAVVVSWKLENRIKIPCCNIKQGYNIKANATKCNKQYNSHNNSKTKISKNGEIIAKT